MSATLKFDFQKRKQLRFSEVNYLSYTKKNPILHVTNYIFPKTRGSKNKRCTHSIPLNWKKAIIAHLNEHSTMLSSQILGVNIV